MYGEIGNYLEYQVAAATPAKLIELLFERALRDLGTAEELIETMNDPRSRADTIRQIVHAQQIVTELQRCLNFEQGGELSINLFRVYEYMQYRLNQAAAEDKFDAVTEVRGLLSELLEGWKVAESQMEEGREAERLQPAMLVG